MTNKIIRFAIIESGLKYYELADLLGISEATLGRKLRKELPEEEQEQIVEIIKRRERV